MAELWFCKPAVASSTLAAGPDTTFATTLRDSVTVARTALDRAAQVQILLPELSIAHITLSALLTSSRARDSHFLKCHCHFAVKTKGALIYEQHHRRGGPSVRQGRGEEGVRRHRLLRREGGRAAA